MSNRGAKNLIRTKREKEKSAKKERKKERKKDI
jgi:hypothetical protein